MRRLLTLLIALLLIPSTLALVTVSGVYTQIGESYQIHHGFIILNNHELLIKNGYYENNTLTLSTGGSFRNGPFVLKGATELHFPELEGKTTKRPVEFCGTTCYTIQQPVNYRLEGYTFVFENGNEEISRFWHDEEQYLIGGLDKGEARVDTTSDTFTLQKATLAVPSRGLTIHGQESTLYSPNEKLIENALDLALNEDEENYEFTFGKRSRVSLKDEAIDISGSYLGNVQTPAGRLSLEGPFAESRARIKRNKTTDIKLQGGVATIKEMGSHALLRDENQELLFTLGEIPFTIHIIDDPLKKWYNSEGFSTKTISEEQLRNMVAPSAFGQLFGQATEAAKKKVYETALDAFNIPTLSTVTSDKKGNLYSLGNGTLTIDSLNLQDALDITKGGPFQFTVKKKYHFSISPFSKEPQRISVNGIISKKVQFTFGTDWDHPEKRTMIKFSLHNIANVGGGSLSMAAGGNSKGEFIIQGHWRG